MLLSLKMSLPLSFTGSFRSITERLRGISIEREHEVLPL